MIYADESYRLKADDLLVFNWGGGVNSTAGIVGMKARGIIPDLIIFADTGGSDGEGEKPETYKYIAVLQAYLQAIHFPALTIVTKTSRYTSLYDQCMKTGYLPSRAYGFGSCADKWKVQPMNKFMNHWGPAVAKWKAGGKVVKAIGYDAYEEHRAKKHEDADYFYWHYLIEWGWNRDDCVREIEQAGLPVPPKSACYFCPSSKKQEVIWLEKHHPQLAEKALQMEDNGIPNSTTVMGLGRNWSWREFLRAPLALQVCMPETPDAPCICRDEGD